MPTPGLRTRADAGRRSTRSRPLSMALWAFGDPESLDALKAKPVPNSLMALLAEICLDRQITPAKLRPLVSQELHGQPDRLSEADISYHFKSQSPRISTLEAYFKVLNLSIHRIGISIDCASRLFAFGPRSKDDKSAPSPRAKLDDLTIAEVNVFINNATAELLQMLNDPITLDHKIRNAIGFEEGRRADAFKAPRNPGKHANSKERAAYEKEAQMIGKKRLDAAVEVECEAAREILLGRLRWLARLQSKKVDSRWGSMDDRGFAPFVQWLESLPQRLDLLPYVNAAVDDQRLLFIWRTVADLINPDEWDDILDVLRPALERHGSWERTHEVVHENGDFWKWEKATQGGLTSAEFADAHPEMAFRPWRGP